jgi:hypothetical protein
VEVETLEKRGSGEDEARRIRREDVFTATALTEDQKNKEATKKRGKNGGDHGDSPDCI